MWGFKVGRNEVNSRWKNVECMCVYMIFACQKLKEEDDGRKIIIDLYFVRNKGSFVENKFIKSTPIFKSVRKILIDSWAHYRTKRFPGSQNYWNVEINKKHLLEARPSSKYIWKAVQRLLFLAQISKGIIFPTQKKLYLKFIAQKYLGDFFSELFSDTFAFFYIISRFNQCKNFLQHFYKNFRLLTLIFDLSPLFFSTFRIF